MQTMFHPKRTGSRTGMFRTLTLVIRRWGQSRIMKLLIRISMSPLRGDRRIQVKSEYSYT